MLNYPLSNIDNPDFCNAGYRIARELFRAVILKRAIGYLNGDKYLTRTRMGPGVEIFARL